jgi:hypothetical protein
MYINIASVRAEYYKIRRIKIVANGRRVGNGDEGCYDYENYVAYFPKRGLNKRNVLHELYHHIAYANEGDISERRRRIKIQFLPSN